MNKRIPNPFYPFNRISGCPGKPKYGLIDGQYYIDGVGVTSARYRRHAILVNAMKRISKESIDDY